MVFSKDASEKGLAIVRIIFGLLLFAHGCQVFLHDEMLSYEPWLTGLGIPLPLPAAYLGKIIELVGGVCLVLGIFTRIACIGIMLTFLFITIVMADGKILTDGQHPFLFFLIAAVFFFTGDGRWSLAKYLKGK